VPLVLDGAIASQIDELEKKLIELRSQDLDTLAGNPEAMAIAEQIQALIEKAKNSTVQVTVRGLERKPWSDLKAKYPPSDPRLYLYAPEIYNEAVPECWVSPEISDELRDKLLTGLTGGQWDHLCAAVQFVNGDVEVPFSALATVALRPSGASEQQPEPTE
jgi:hypothetical protein